MASIIQKSILKGSRASGVRWWSNPRWRDMFPLPSGVRVQTYWQVWCTGRPHGSTMTRGWAAGRWPTPGRALIAEAYPPQPTFGQCARIGKDLSRSSQMVFCPCLWKTSSLTWRSEGREEEAVDGGAVAHTQVPWCAGGRALRLFKDWDLSLKSDGFCCETSTRALATISPEEGKEMMPIHAF